MSELAIPEHLSSTPTPAPCELRDIKLSAGRTLRATPVFDTYWRFAARRQELFMSRVSGSAVADHVVDPVMANYRFTNVYRAADRVSQYLIRHVLYEGDQAPKEVFFRCVLFKLFNRIETWEHLSSTFGPPTLGTFDSDRFARALDELAHSGATRIYSGAYIMPCPPFGQPRKHSNHLRLLNLMLEEDAPNRIQDADSLREVYSILKSYPSIGPFLAFQLTIDLNYSTLIDFSEMDFVVAGPGALGGLSKCFRDTCGLDEADVIRAVTDLASSEFDRLNLDFQDLWGRPLQLIDVQNIFCEVDKYARIVHPLHLGNSTRTRIKRRYQPNPEPLPQWYPPKWSIVAFSLVP